VTEHWLERTIRGDVSSTEPQTTWTVVREGDDSAVEDGRGGTWPSHRFPRQVPLPCGVAGGAGHQACRLVGSSAPTYAGKCAMLLELAVSTMTARGYVRA
jgi:hypothetical protein